MDVSTDAYVLSGTDATTIEAAASDLTASGEQDVLVGLSSTEQADLVTEIYNSAQSAFSGKTVWTVGNSNPGTLNYPNLAALYGVLGGTDTWTLHGHT